jgi:hypothetical protein
MRSNGHIAAAFRIFIRGWIGRGLAAAAHACERLAHGHHNEERDRDADRDERRQRVMTSPTRNFLLLIVNRIEEKSGLPTMSPRYGVITSLTNLVTTAANAARITTVTAENPRRLGYVRPASAKLAMVRPGVGRFDQNSDRTDEGYSIAAFRLDFDLLSRLWRCRSIGIHLGRIICGRLNRAGLHTRQVICQLKTLLAV